MEEMFYKCYPFNQDLNDWNVNDDHNIRYMFYNCISLKKCPEWIKNMEK